MSTYTEERQTTGLEIAVVGMAGRFPGAVDVDAFWRNVAQGVESLLFLSDDELADRGVDRRRLENPSFVAAGGGVLTDADCFDAGLFGYTPMEAGIMAPQTRLFLQCAWEALEHAGYDPVRRHGVVGLFAGAGSSFYWEAACLMAGGGGGLDTASLLRDKDFMAALTAFKLNLTGPVVSVQTACSTSLVAVHLGCQSLLAAECDMALAGGARVSFMPKQGYFHQEGGVLSSDGHCRAFDETADGCIPGDGVGLVVLKRLEDAVSDGDTIHAVVLGSAMDNDGANRVGFSAPGVEGQANVIAAAIRMAEVPPGSVGYVEAHGTGTPLGDPIEVEALRDAYGAVGNRSCALGSVKTNIGHSDAAAGVAGLIKAVMALKHGKIPPSLNFQAPNKALELQDSPFYVSAILDEWPAGPHPRRAGVSAFGIGGTNVHVILEEAGSRRSETAGVTSETSSEDFYLITLSAQTKETLERTTANLVSYLQKHPAVSLADLSYTLHVGRAQLTHRKKTVCRDIRELTETLADPGSRVVHTGRAAAEQRRLVFLFSGQGSAYVNMGLELYCQLPLFREFMDRCFDLIRAIAGQDLKPYLYPKGDLEAAQERFQQQDTIQPLLFSFEYSLYETLRHWGIRPDALAGYSLGDYTCACVSGVLSLEDALTLVIQRGRLMQRVPPGVMLNVPMPVAELTPYLRSDISVAVDNGLSCIVSGTEEAVVAMESRLKTGGLMPMRLAISHAGHSAMLDPILDDFRLMLDGLTFNPPRIPFVSSVTGTWITETDAVDPGYWVRQLRHTVYLSKGIEELADLDDPLFLEIGPGQDLCALVARVLGQGTDNRLFSVVKARGRKMADTAFLLNRLGDLWLRGVAVDWRRVNHGEGRRRIPLPTYPFKAERFPFKEFNIQAALAGRRKHSEPLRKECSDWFYIPSPRRQELEMVAEPEPGGDGKWLIFDNGSDWSRRLARRLSAAGGTVLTVIMGEEFCQLDETSFACDPRQKNHYVELADQLARLGYWPCHVIHTWLAIPERKPLSDLTNEAVDVAQHMGFFSVLYFIQALEDRGMPGGLEFNLDVVAGGVLDITGNETLAPERAPIMGPLKVIPQEYPSIKCRMLDVEEPTEGAVETLGRQVFEEVNAPLGHHMVAFRGSRRWIVEYRPVRIQPPAEGQETIQLRPGGVYVVIGGLGNIAFVLEHYLAGETNAKLALLGRTPLPERESWQDYLDHHGEEDPLARKLSRMIKLESLGAEVLPLAVDVGNAQLLKEAFDQIEQRFGRIDGVIHSAAELEGNMRMISRMDRQEVARQFQAKVVGLLALRQALAGRAYDFCLLMSSIASVLGGLGFSAYAAANWFMDTFVLQYNKHGGNPWFSVGWDGWTFEEEADQEEVSPMRMTFREGPEAFRRVLACGKYPYLTHSLIDLQRRIDRWVNLESLQETVESKESEPVGHPRPDLANPYVEPSTDIQKEMCRLWRELFGYSDIGVEDDFFELGGDSLKAITVIAKTQKALGVHIPLKDFFDHPTIESLSRLVGTGDGAEAVDSIEPVEKKEYYHVSSAQKRLFVHYLADTGSLQYNESQLVPFPGDSRPEPIEEALRRLIRRHENLRASLFLRNGEPAQRILDEVEFHLPYEEVSIDQLQDRIDNFKRPFDLGRPPLFRAGLFKITGGQCWLVVDMHHLITDLVSHQLLRHEVTHYLRGGDLPPLELHYKDYAEWQHRRKDHVNGQRDYWTGEFAHMPPELELPTDFQWSGETPAWAQHVEFTAEGALVENLRTLARGEGVTFFVALLSILYILLAKITGKDDIVIGTPVSGRRNSDLESMIGMFVNTLPLRNFPVADKTFRQFLSEVGERVIQALDHQDFQFEDLLDALGIKRQPGKFPLMDVGFVYERDESSGGKPTSDAASSAIRPARTNAKVALVLAVRESVHEVRFTFEYSTALFAAETINRYCGYFKDILGAVSADPGKRIQDIDIDYSLSEATDNGEFGDFDF